MIFVFDLGHHIFDHLVNSVLDLQTELLFDDVYLFLKLLILSYNQIFYYKQLIHNQELLSFLL